MCGLILPVCLVLVAKNTTPILAASSKNRTIYFNLRLQSLVQSLEAKQDLISNDRQLASAIARYHGVFGIGNANEDEMITSRALIVHVRECQKMETNVTLEFPLSLPRVENDPEVINTAR